MKSIWNELKKRIKQKERPIKNLLDFACSIFLGFLQFHGKTLRNHCPPFYLTKALAHSFLVPFSPRKPRLKSFKNSRSLF
jgi:hypothetical protein